jgi:hypothetical protein
MISINRGKTCRNVAGIGSERSGSAPRALAGHLKTGNVGPGALLIGRLNRPPGRRAAARPWWARPLMCEVPRMAGCGAMSSCRRAGLHLRHTTYLWRSS